MALVSAVAMLLLGQRVTDYSHLQQALASGRVNQVRVEGAFGHTTDLPAEATGTTQVRIVWRDGLLERVTEVQQYHPGDGMGEPVEGYPSITGEVEDALRDIDPQVSITWADPRSSWSNLAGFQGPVWIISLILLAAAGIVTLLLGGPEPRLATRWGWIWLLSSPLTLVVALAFLLVGCRGHQPGRRRLTGGWAFVLKLLLGGLGLIL
ncbi:hypothetical protein GCM10009599_11120 [Luteococcus peritonei]